jgi:DNA-binding CsgD family transcriptional regulator
LSPLLERDTELETIGSLLGEAHDGRGACVLVEGAAGIGKTRLLAAARELAGFHGLQVLQARGGELERDFPYGVVRQLFEAPLAGGHAELLAEAAGLAAPLFDQRPATSDPFALLHGLYWLTVNAAQASPLLMAVDDLHWCDAPSLRFLVYLVRRLDGLPVLVAVSTRRGEAGADESAITELGADPLSTTIRPAPLSLGAVAEILRAALDAEPEAEFELAVHTACGGNPLLLRELTSAIAAARISPDGTGATRVRELAPDSISHLVLQRLKRLGPAAEAVAVAVALLGDDCELAVVAALADVPLEAAASAAAELGRVEILRSHGGLGFAHPVLRAAVYAHLADAERALAHERAAEVLANNAVAPERVAAQLVHVAPRGRSSVVGTLREAARSATAHGAGDIARRYLERALAEPPGAMLRSELLLELGEAEVASGAPGALDHLRQAHAQLDGARAVEAARALASAAYAAGDSREAADVLAGTIEALDPSDGAMGLRLEAELITFARFDAQLYPMARDRLMRVADRVSQETFGGRFLLGLLASELARACKASDRARALAHRALAGGLPGDDESFAAFLVPAQTLVTLDELDAALRVHTEWLEDARRRGSVFAFAHASAFRAFVRLRRGELIEAEADARNALDAVEPLIRAGAYDFTWSFLAEVLAERGEPAEAARTIERARQRDDAPAYQAAAWLNVRGLVRAALGDDAGALADSLAAGERFDSIAVRNPSYSSWRSRAALLLARAGERERACALADEEAELARMWGAPRPLAIALRAQGLIAGGEAGTELLQRSADTLVESPAQLERARSLVELGASLRRLNRRRDARIPLGEALELAHRCGARPLTERAHTELLATGARPRRLVRTGLDSLTASERRVAQLAATGQTNREIAQSLFVTPKTVEMHLSNTYRKLGIQSRLQLARALRSRSG